MSCLFAAMDGLASLSDCALLDRLQRGAFDYLTDHTDPATALVADTSRLRSPCSIAVVGFALSCYPIAVGKALDVAGAPPRNRRSRTLQFFWASSPKASLPDASGYKGFYYHFLDMHRRQTSLAV